MKTILLSLVVFLSLPGYLHAQDKFDELTTTKGKTYKGVTVKGKGALGISIKRSGGLANIPFAELPADIQKKLGYDAKKAQDFKKGQADKMKNAKKAASAAKIKAIITRRPEKGEIGHPILHMLKISGTVNAIVDGGLLMQRGWVSHPLEPIAGKPTRRAEEDCLFILGEADNYKAGDYFKGIVYFSGFFQYKTVGGEFRQVPKYAISLEKALMAYGIKN